jgi:hypothetical protein
MPLLLLRLLTAAVLLQLPAAAAAVEDVVAVLAAPQSEALAKDHPHARHPPACVKPPTTSSSTANSMVQPCRMLQKQMGLLNINDPTRACSRDPSMHHRL